MSEGRIPKKLYSVHCGFYDRDVLDGIFESHVNFFVVAADFEDARVKAKQHSVYRLKKMHIDGIQEIRSIDGFRIEAIQDEMLQGQTEVIPHHHRELAPKSPSSTNTATAQM